MFFRGLGTLWLSLDCPLPHAQSGTPLVWHDGSFCSFLPSYNHWVSHLLGCLKLEKLKFSSCGEPECFLSDLVSIFGLLWTCHPMSLFLVFNFFPFYTLPLLPPYPYTHIPLGVIGDSMVFYFFYHFIYFKFTIKCCFVLVVYLLNLHIVVCLCSLLPCQIAKKQNKKTNPIKIISVRKI